MRYRLYFFVPYNLSEIQKGIQAGHAALEYAHMYGETPQFINFVINYKTWVILNGGTTRDFCGMDGEIGSMNEIVLSLIAQEIRHAVFYEEDLNGALTAVCFLADERVWDKEMYPDLEDADEEHACDKLNDWVRNIGGEKNLFLRGLLADKTLA